MTIEGELEALRAELESERSERRRIVAMLEEVLPRLEAIEVRVKVLAIDRDTFDLSFPQMIILGTLVYVLLSANPDAIVALLGATK